MEIQDILLSNDKELILGLFRFNPAEEDKYIIAKFNLWARHFFPKYFKAHDAGFHAKIDAYNLRTYKGTLRSFTDIAFRGAAKSTRTKLFIAFCMANDMTHFRRYLKILTKDPDNAKQYVTDVYNMFVDPQVHEFYPEVFAKTATKREERMEAFTTATGVKMISDSVGVAQRGQLQEDIRPDWIIFDDFETRSTLRSAVETQSIYDNMEEARTGLAKNGSMIYNCNYISERGNVHRLVQAADDLNKVLITPIKVGNIPMWSAYTIGEINQIEKDAEDFEGEYMCEPSASTDVFFDRPTLKRMIPAVPLKVISDFKIFRNYDASHRYGAGADVAGGVGLDSSTSVFIDFSTIPCRVVATYKNNLIKPDSFGHELANEGNRFGACMIAPEKNNHGQATIAILKQNYDNIYTTQNTDTKTDGTNQTREYGWDTNGATKPKMLFAAKKAIEDGLVLLEDEALIAEAIQYSRDDLMDKPTDPRLTTRHFDLLMAFAIAWQLKDWAQVAPKEENINEVGNDQPIYPEIWRA